MSLSRVAHDFDENSTFAGAVEFAQEDALPRAKCQSAVLNQNRLARAGEYRFHMRIGVSFNVAVRPFMRNQAVENAFDVAGYVWVGVLIDGDSRSGVRHVDVAYAAADSRIANYGFNCTSDVDELSASRSLDAKRFHAARIVMESA